MNPKPTQSKSIRAQLLSAMRDGEYAHCDRLPRESVLSEKLGIRDDRQLCFDLLAEKHILMVAGSGFDWPEPNHFRLVLLPEPETLYRAVLDIGDFLQHYHQ